MSSIKSREIKEAPYIIHNKDVLSVCRGSFYIKGRNIHEPCKNREKCQKYAKYKERKEDTPQVGFYYVDSFRKCDLWKYKTIDGAYALQIAIYNILYVNDLACACIVDLMDFAKYLDTQGLKILKAINKRKKTYEKKLYEIIGADKLDFLANYNLAMDEHVMPIIKQLRTDIFDYLNQNEICMDEAKLFSYAELAYIICGYSLISIDNRIEEVRKYNKDAIGLSHYKLAEITQIVKNLCNWIERKVNRDINLNNCANINSTYKKLDKILTNPQIITECIENAKMDY